jgi:biopolymer transport protein ExbD
MRSWPKRRERKARVEIIPMIDVMMFLLVFFVLISVNVIPNRSLNIAVPTSSTSEQINERKRLTITIAPTGELFLEGDPVELPELAGKLREAIGEARPLVTIAGDAQSDLQRLVDVIGALKQAGVPGAAIVARQR